MIKQIKASVCQGKGLPAVKRGIASVFMGIHFDAVSFVSCYGYHDIDCRAPKRLRRFSGQ